MAKLEDCPHTKLLGCSLSCIDIKYFGCELTLKYKISVPLEEITFVIMLLLGLNQRFDVDRLQNWTILLLQKLNADFSNAHSFT